MTETSTGMLRVVINRPMWYRGNGSISSRLLRSQDGKMCCIGFASLDAGADPREIFDRSFISHIFVADKKSVISSWDFSILEQLYEENDYDADEAIIIDLGRKINIEFVFVN